MQVSYLSTFDKIFEFERELAAFTGAPYAVMTDCCTHAIELCLRYEQVTHCEFTAFTYLSIPMTMHKLGISYRLLTETWIGEYRFVATNIWDSARRLESNMYRPGMMQCLSFGHGKSLQINRGGAILLDDKAAYQAILLMRYDGRDLTVKPWTAQQQFRVGYHYRPTVEEAQRGSKLLKRYVGGPPLEVVYPDCRQMSIVS